MADSSHGTGGVCRVVTIGTQAVRHRDRQVVEARVVHEVEGPAPVRGSSSMRSR